MHRPRPTRLADFPYVGKHHYSLRFATRARRRAFESAGVARATIVQIQQTCGEENFAILAHCVMPDHVHLVLEGCERSDLRRCVKLTKQRVEYAARRQFGIQGLWQVGYYERILRSRHALETVVRYVLDNPVRAGLVKKAEDYPFSGSSPSHLVQTFEKPVRETLE